MTQATRHFQHIEARQREINWKGVTKAIILLGLGFDLALLMITDTLSFYLSPHFMWLTMVAMLLFLFFGALTAFDVWQEWREALHDHDHDHDHHDHDHDHHDHDHDHHHDHVHAHVTWPVLMVIAIPLLLGVLVPPQPLGASAVNGGVSTTSVGVADAESAARPPLERTVIDWLRQFEASDDLSGFVGQPVDVVGFVYKEPDYDASQFMLARFAISCCVADAFAIGLPMQVDGTNTFAVDTWLRVRGTLEIGMFGEQEMLIVRPTSIEAVPMPNDPYLYT